MLGRDKVLSLGFALLSLGSLGALLGVSNDASITVAAWLLSIVGAFWYMSGRKDSGESSEGITYEYHGCGGEKTPRTFTWVKEDCSINQSIPLGNIVLDFNKDAELVGFEIIDVPEGLIGEEYMQDGSCSNPSKEEVRTKQEIEKGE